MLKYFAGALRLVAAAMCAMLFMTTAAYAQKWSTLAPFPEGSEELYGITAGGKLQVFGGIAAGWKPKGLSYEYDPATNAWTKRKNMPLLSHHVALAELNGKVYVIGGFKYPDSGPAAWQPIDNVWEYDPGTDNWKALAPLPTKRGSPSAEVVNGKIHVIGGATMHPGSKEVSIHPARPHRAVGTHEVYDPATNTWESRSPMPTARNHAASGVVNNKIYVIGGRVGAAFITRASNVDVVEVYDPATDQWGPLLAPMPEPRSAMVWGTHGGRIYMTGGENRTSRMSTTYRAFDAYDPATNSWISMPPMVYSRHGLAGDFIGNKFHAVSGNSQSGGAPGAHVESDVHEVFTLPAK